MPDIAQYREFESPHNYVHGDCCVKSGVAYQCTNLNGTGGRWIEEDWSSLGTDDDESEFALMTALKYTFETC